MKKVLLSMGSCVSMRESSDSTVRWSCHSKDEASSKKIIASAASCPQLNSTPGNKEEVFFDSQPWIESDSEEFLSVNGDNTPSFGRSPNHQLNNAGIVVVDQKKKLSELFCESFSNDHERDNDVQHSVSQTEILDTNCDGTDNNDRKGVEVERKRSMRGGGYCLPGLVRSLSCGERKKRHSGGGSSTHGHIARG